MNKQKVVVIIPVYNEQDKIEKTIENIKNITLIDNIVIVDDGSTDKTVDIVKKMGKDLIKLDKNSGKGFAIKEALKSIDYEYVVLLDGDLGESSGEVDKLIMPVLNNECDVTIARFKKAKKNNLGVIIMKPLAGGAITKGDLSLRFILENENVTSVIPGMGSREEIEENTSVGKDLRGLTDEEREILNEEVSSLGIHFCRRCGYCLPCTVGIDIPTQFVIDAYYTRYNLPDWAIDRYRKLDIKAKDCIECGKCLDRCPYDLPIIDMLKDVEEHLGK